MQKKSRKDGQKLQKWLQLWYNQKMKKRFSDSWVGSKQPRKQRKYRYNAPMHLRHKMIAANLSKDLRKKYGKRSIPLRKGDTVKIMRGEFKKKKGKIETVNLNTLKVYIEGIQRSKKDGTKTSVPFEPSNVQIIELNMDDKKRTDALERKAKPVIRGEKKQVIVQKTLPVMAKKEISKPNILPTKSKEIKK